MDLDRPILQREKFELIMLEKQIDSDGNFTKGEEEIKVYEIKNAMVDRMKQRKVNNRQQLGAYKKLCDFMRERFYDEKINPNRLEINLCEVLKKIVEIGWIITETEMMQIFSFINLQSEMLRGKENYQLKRFIQKCLVLFEIGKDINQFFSK